MAYDGEIRLNADMQTTGVKGGSKEMQAAIKSLLREVNNTDKAMRKSLTGYADALQSDAASTNNYYDSLERLKEKADELRSVLSKREYSTAFEVLQLDASKAKEELAKLRAEKERLEKEPREMDTSNYATLSQQAEELSMKMAELDKQKKYWEQFGKIQDPRVAAENLQLTKAQIDEVNKKFNEMSSVLNEMENHDISLNVDTQSVENKIQFTIEKLAELEDRKQEMINNNTAYESNDDSEAQLAKLEQQIALMEKAAQQTPEYQEQMARKLQLGIAEEEGYISGLEELLDELCAKQIELGDAVFGSADAYDQWAERVDALPNGIGNIEEEIDSLTQAIAENEAIMAEEGNSAGFEDWYQGIEEETEELKQQLADLQSVANETAEAFHNRQDYSEWVELEEKINQVNNAIQEAQARVSDMNAEMGNLGDNTDLSGVQEVKSSVESVAESGEEAQASVRNIGTAAKEASNGAKQLSDAFRSVVTAISNSTTGILSSFGNIASTALNVTGKIITGFSRVISAISRVISAIGQVISAISKVVNAIASFISAITKVISAIGKFISTIWKVISAIFQFISSIAKAASAIVGKLVNALKKAISTITTTTVKLAKMVGSATIKGLQKLGSAALKTASQIAQIGANATKSVFSKLGTYIANATKSILNLGNSAKKSSGGFQIGLKTLLRYGLGVRSTYALINKLRSALGDAINNLVQESPRLNAAMSSMTSALNTLKNSIATAFEPIITAVAPYVTRFLELLTAAMTKVGEFFAAITGQNTIFKAKSIYTDYAKSLDKTTDSTKESSNANKKNKKTIKDTTKAAKEAERVLAGFDELNILSDSRSKDSDPSSSTADALDDLADSTEEAKQKLFDEKPINSAFGDWFKHLIDLFKAGKYSEIGKILAKKINDVFKKINKLLNWKRLGKTITKYIKGFTTIFNSLVDNINWKLIGKTFADAINVLIHTVNLLVTGIDWVNLGKKLGEGFGALFLGIEWDLLGETIAEWITIKLRVIAGAITSFPWEEVGTKIATGINSLFARLGEILDSIPWSEMASKIVSGINSLIAGIDPVVIGTTIGSAIKGALEFITTAIDEFDAKGAGELLWQTVVNIKKSLEPPGKLGHLLASAINKALDFINAAAGDWTWGTEAGSSFATEINTIVDEINPEQLGATLQGAINTALDFLITALSEFHFGEAGAKFGATVGELDISKNLIKLGQILRLALEGALDWMLGALIAFSIPDSDPQHVQEQIDNMSLDEKIAALGPLLGGLMKAALGAIIDGILGFVIGGNDADHVKEQIDNMSPEEKINMLGDALKSAMKAALGCILDAILTLTFTEKDGDNVDTQLENLTLEEKFTLLGGRILTWMGNALNNIGGAITEFKLGNKGRILALKISGGLNSTIGQKKTWKSVGGFFNTALNGALDFTIGFLAGLQRDNSVPDTEKDIQEWLDTLSVGEKLQWIIKNIPWKPAFTSLFTAFKTALKELNESGALGDLRDSIVGLPWSEWFLAIIEKIKEVLPETQGLLLQLLFGKDYENSEMYKKIMEIIDAAASVGDGLGKARKAAEGFEKAVKTAFTPVAGAASFVSGLFGKKQEKQPTGLGRKEAFGDYNNIFSSLIQAIDNGKDAARERMLDAIDDIMNAGFDAEKPGMTQAEQFYNGFKKKVFDGAGNIKPQFKGVISSIFDESQISALESGELTLEDFYGALSKSATDGQGNITSELQSLFDAIFTDSTGGTLLIGQQAGDDIQEGLTDREPFGVNIETTIDGNTDGNSAGEKVQEGLTRNGPYGLDVETTYNGDSDPNSVADGVSNAFANLNRRGVFARVKGTVNGKADPSSMATHVRQSFNDDIPANVGISYDGRKDAWAARKDLDSAYSEDVSSNVDLTYDNQSTPTAAYNEFKSPFATQVNTPIGLQKSGWTDVQSFIGVAKDGIMNIKVKLQNAVENASNWFSGLFGGKSNNNEVSASDISKPYTDGAAAAKTAMDGIKADVESMKKDVSGKLGTLSTTISTKMTSMKTTMTTGFQTIKTNVTTYMTTLQTDITNKVTGISTIITAKMLLIKTNVATQLTSIKGTVSTFTTAFKLLATTAMGAIETSVKTKVTSIKTAVTTAFSTIKTNISNQSNTAKTNASNAFSGMKTNITNSMNGLKSSISNLGWYNVGTNIVQGIYNGINGWWNWLNNTVWNLAVGLYNTACNALGIHSPSKVFADGVGKNVSLGIAEGIENAAPSAVESLNGLTDDMIKQMSRMDAIGSSVTIRPPEMALGTVLPYNVQASLDGGSNGITDAIEASNIELGSVIINAVNNATVALVRAIEEYSTTNINIDKRSLTDVLVEEINRRTKAQGASPLLI